MVAVDGPFRSGSSISSELVNLEENIVEFLLEIIDLSSAKHSVEFSSVPEKKSNRSEGIGDDDGRYEGEGSRSDTIWTRNMVKI